MRCTLGQALAWRIDRQHLRTGAASVEDVVRRLGAVPAWSGDPELAIGRRLAEPGEDSVAAALGDGRLLRTYAFRGATHLLAADEAGVYLAVRGASRQWELPAWRSHYDLAPGDWPPLRELVRDALSGGPISHAALVEAVAGTGRFRHLRAGLTHPSQTLLKPLAWQGDLALGPTIDGQPTFQSPDASPRWAGLPAPDDAGKRAVVAYLSAYGPASLERLRYWLVAGLSAGRRRLDGWVAELSAAGTIVEVTVDGVPEYHLREYLDSLAAARPLPAEVTLLPGYDQWVLGPGTADEQVVPAGLRPAMTRGANIVLRGGRVAGSWTIRRDEITIVRDDPGWAPGEAQLGAEVGRLSRLRGIEAGLTVALV
jgi:hypothetical protein